MTGCSNTLGENDEGKWDNGREKSDQGGKVCHNKRTDWPGEMRGRLLVTRVSERGTGNTGMPFTEIRTTTGGEVILVFRWLN